MGRIEKQKRLIIEQSNKRILGESTIDIDEVLSLMKYKFGWGDLSGERIEEFENWSDEVSNQMSSEEYADLFHDYMADTSQPNNNDIDGDIGDLEIDIDGDGDPEHFDIIKKDSYDSWHPDQSV
jgi:hypothetical protein